MKKTFTILILAFVALSVLMIFIGKTDKNVSDENLNAADTDLPSKAQLALYYFHGDVRCQTCLALENFAKLTVDSLYNDKVESEDLIFQTVNYDLEQSKNLVDQLGITYQALVIVDYRVEPPTVVNLEKIWDYSSDQAAYSAYVKENLDQFLIN